MKWLYMLLMLPLLIFGGLLVLLAVMQLTELLKDIWRNGL